LHKQVNLAKSNADILSGSGETKRNGGRHSFFEKAFPGSYISAVHTEDGTNQRTTPYFHEKRFYLEGRPARKNDKPWNHPAKCDLLLVYNPIHAHQIESLAVQFESPLRLGTHPGYDELYNILYEMPPNGDFKRFLQDVVQLIKSFRNHDEPALV
jgi:hypothetical protein